MEQTVWTISVEEIERVEGVKWRDEQTINVYRWTNQMATQCSGGRKLRMNDTA